METTAFLAGIRVFPVKSLDALDLGECAILPSGALALDREFALLDTEGKFVNAKRFAQIQCLRSTWDREGQVLSLRLEDTSDEVCFHLPAQQSALEAWVGAWLEQPVSLTQNLDGGFPDDRLAPGPTLISTGTLEAVAAWYPGVTVEEARRRFRANLEIGGVPAFWEDQLFAGAGEAVPFQIGDVIFRGVNPCQRCIVPTRDSFSAEASSEFSQIFRANREAALPSWADRSRFNHFYRLAVNTCVLETEAGKSVRIGDSIGLLSAG